MIYCYRTTKGEVHELCMTMDEMQKRQGPDGEILLDDGTLAYRDYVAEKGNFIHTYETEIESDGLGCHPSQVSEFEKHAAEIGVPTKFSPENGCAVFNGRQHRNRYINALNRSTGTKVFDRDGAYSDPQA